VGLARGITAINRNVVKSIFTSWLGTVPAAALLTVLFYLIAILIFW
jgi:PiT family inorganic phosphate transporter